MPNKEMTVLLRAWSQGDIEARDEVWPLLYDELKVVAHSVLRSRRGNARLSTTSLVHDAALRLLDVDIDWQDRHHFYAAAARAMRFILVDEARRRLAKKRGGGEVEITEKDDGDIVDPNPARLEEMINVHQTLKRLAGVNRRHERLVELRYFAGHSVGETAEILGVSVPTVVRDWRAVRMWLHGALHPTT